MKDIRLACFSDIHLGHRRNDSHEMIKALDKCIHQEGLLERIDILFLAGDVFDRLLDLNHAAISDIDYWIAKLIHGCETHGVTLRVLEGTPSHDREQSERFVTIHKLMDSKTNFRYVKQVEIEYIPHLECNVLYIPDEFSPTCAETLAVVQKAMKAQALEQVDIAVMHGQFAHQLPAEIKDLDCHDTEAYLNLTKSLILIGHVHHHSVMDKIVAQGSFDRLAHGEEEAKGYVYVEIKNGVARPYFIENKDARIYKTIAVYGMDMVQVYEHLTQALDGMLPLSCIRIEAEPTHPVFANFNEVMRAHSTMVWSKLAKTIKGDHEKVRIVNEFDKWSPVEITPANIEDLLMRSLAKRNLSEEQLKLSRHHLQAVLNEV